MSKARSLRSFAYAIAVAVTLVFVLATNGQAAYPGPNGRIAFQSLAPDGNGIFTIDPALPNDVEKRLTIGGVAPFWSPDGSKIAYTDGQDLLVVRVNPNGTANGDAVNLTNTTNASVLRGTASWSPDGTKLVYERWSDKNKIDVWYADVEIDWEADGNKVVRFDEHLLASTKAVDGDPAWSPFDDRIAFSSDCDGDYEIYTLPVTNSTPTRANPCDTATKLTNNLVLDGAPDWSPDGQKIVFTRTAGKGKAANTDIYTMPVSGESPDAPATRLTTSASVEKSGDWSSDGQLIAFSSDRDGDHEIYTMPVSGESSGAQATRKTENTYDDFSPDWQRVAPEPPQCVIVCL